MSFNPLDYPLCLKSPHHLSDVISWHEHIPFAFAIMKMIEPKLFVELGTHKGDSYLAFCQAVDSLGLDTLCYAVDSWEGDEQAGFYEVSVYEELRKNHDSLYARFSTLLKCYFDQALPKFSDGSIDLLHIDGLHTYDAVKHDFENWLPKMSDRGVILFHDTTVREGDFGVWKLFEELQNRYPAFGFEHGNGLGIIAVGSIVPKALEDFFYSDIKVKNDIAEFFYLAGNRISLAHTVQMQREQISSLNSRLWDNDVILAETNRQLAESSRRIVGHDQILAESNWQSDELRQLLVDKDRLLAQKEQYIIELLLAMAESTRQFGEFQQLIVGKDQLLAQKEQYITELLSALAESTRQLAERDGQLAESNRQLAESADQINILNVQMAARETELSNIVNSLSWKITAPLRCISKYIYKALGQ